MKIKKEELQNLLEDFPSLNITLAMKNLSESDDIEVVDGQIIMESKITKDSLSQMPSGKEINITLDSFVYDKINKLYPNKFPLIEYSVHLEEAEEILEKVEYMNRYSARKRHLIFARDIAERKTSSGVNILPISLGEAVTKEKLKTIRILIRNDQLPEKIAISLGEKGILSYIEKADEDFGASEKLNEAIVATKLPNSTISDKIEFTHKFKSLKPKLVILAYQKQSINSMTLFLYIKTIDPFCKILEFNEIAIEKGSKYLINAIKNAYERFYYEEVALITKRKIKLTEEVEERLKKEIHNLALNYSHSKYIVVAYRIHKLGEEHDTIILQNMLEKTKNSVK